MYVCMYVCIHTYVYIDTYEYTSLVPSLRILGFIGVCMYVYTQIRMYVCLYVCIYIHTYVCTYVLGALIKDLGVYRRRRLGSQLYHAPITRYSSQKRPSIEAKETYTKDKRGSAVNSIVHLSQVLKNWSPSKFTTAKCTYYKSHFTTQFTLVQKSLYYGKEHLL
jgi:hypothetical protein